MRQDRILRIKDLVTQLLKEIEPETFDREGLADTPNRVAKMYAEIFRGYDPAQLPAVTTFRNGADGITVDQMITDEGTFFSQCEHHMAVFYGTYKFAYLPSPKGKILGLSKVARVVDHYAARLQVQERLVGQIVTHLTSALCLPEPGKKGKVAPPLGMALVLKGVHTCKCMRGVKKGGFMTTSSMTGIFKKKASVKQEFFSLFS